MGGGIVPTLGATRARVVTGAGALVLAVLLTATPAAVRGFDGLPFVAIAALGIPLTLVALAGRSAAATWAVIVLGAGYAGAVVGHEGIDVRAPLVGAGLLALSELIHGSLRVRSIASEGALRRRELIDLGLAWLGAVTTGSIVIAAGSAHPGGAVALAVVGVVLSLAILGLILFLARRAFRPSSTSSRA